MSEEESRDLFEGIRSLLAARPRARARIVIVEIDGAVSHLGNAIADDPVLKPKFNIQGHGAIALAAVDLLATEDPAKFAVLTQLMLNDPRQRGDAAGFAAWPDRIKMASGADGALGRARKPDHYQDFPHQMGGAETQLPATSLGPGRLLDALVEWTTALKNETDAEKRGTALAFVLHLVGDVHQPLHCAAVLDAQLFPNGDEGGNKIWWDASPTMHGLWDDAIVKNATQVAPTVSKIKARMDRNAFKKRLARKSFREWAEESYLQAIDAYETFFGESNYLGPAQRVQHGSTTHGQLFDAPSAEYRKNAREQALDQAAIAAIRLCDVLKDAL